MRIALEEGREALLHDEIPIGCVIVCEGRIIGRGHNLTETLQDVTAHAEMQAITAAAGMLGGKYLRGCTLYVTIEPCVMCAGALAWAQIGRIVYGAHDVKRGYGIVEKCISSQSLSLLHPKTVVEGGVMEAECAGLLRDFFGKKR